MNSLASNSISRIIGVLGVAVVVLMLTNRQGYGQGPGEQTPTGSTPGQDPKRATNPFPPPPPPPDDPNERDVAKRDLFLSVINRHRVCFGCCTWRVDRLSEAGDDVSPDAKEKFLETWLSLVTSELRAPHEEAIKWYGQWVHADEGPKLLQIVAEWGVADYLVRFSQLADSDRYCSVTVRSPRRPGLEFHRKPAALDKAQHPAWESVPRAQLSGLLAELISLDREKVELLGSHGRITGGAGVEVFTGTFDWQNLASSAPAQDLDPVTGVLATPMPERILITNSDPQYVCIRFDLHPGG